jgi:hypothetical protein
MAWLQKHRFVHTAYCLFFLKIIFSSCAPKWESSAGGGFCAYRFENNWEEEG